MHRPPNAPTPPPRPPQPQSSGKEERETNGSLASLLNLAVMNSASRGAATEGESCASQRAHKQNALDDEDDSVEVVHGEDEEGFVDASLELELNAVAIGSEGFQCSAAVKEKGGGGDGNNSTSGLVSTRFSVGALERPLLSREEGSGQEIRLTEFKEYLFLLRRRRHSPTAVVGVSAGNRKSAGTTPEHQYMLDKVASATPLHLSRLLKLTLVHASREVGIEILAHWLQLHPNWPLYGSQEDLSSDLLLRDAISISAAFYISPPRRNKAKADQEDGVLTSDDGDGDDRNILLQQLALYNLETIINECLPRWLAANPLQSPTSLYGFVATLILVTGLRLFPPMVGGASKPRATLTLTSPDDRTSRHRKALPTGALINRGRQLGQIWSLVEHLFAKTPLAGPGTIGTLQALWGYLQGLFPLPSGGPQPQRLDYETWCLLFDTLSLDRRGSSSRALVVGEGKKDKTTEAIQRLRIFDNTIAIRHLLWTCRYVRGVDGPLGVTHHQSSESFNEKFNDAVLYFRHYCKFLEEASSSSSPPADAEYRRMGIAQTAEQSRDTDTAKQVLGASATAPHSTAGKTNSRVSPDSLKRAALHKDSTDDSSSSATMLPVSIGNGRKPCISVFLALLQVGAEGGHPHALQCIEEDVLPACREVSVRRYLGKKVCGSVPYAEGRGLETIQNVGTAVELRENSLLSFQLGCLLSASDPTDGMEGSDGRTNDDESTRTPGGGADDEPWWSFFVEKSLWRNTNDSVQVLNRLLRLSSCAIDMVVPPARLGVDSNSSSTAMTTSNNYGCLSTNLDVITEKAIFLVAVWAMMEIAPPSATSTQDEGRDDEKVLQGYLDWVLPSSPLRPTLRKDQGIMRERRPWLIALFARCLRPDLVSALMTVDPWTRKLAFPRSVHLIMAVSRMLFHFGVCPAAGTSTPPSPSSYHAALQGIALALRELLNSEEFAGIRLKDPYVGWCFSGTVAPTRDQQSNLWRFSALAATTTESATAGLDSAELRRQSFRRAVRNNFVSTAKGGVGSSMMAPTGVPVGESQDGGDGMGSSSAMERIGVLPDSLADALAMASGATDEL